MDWSLRIAELRREVTDLNAQLEDTEDADARQLLQRKIQAKEKEIGDLESSMSRSSDVPPHIR